MCIYGPLFIFNQNLNVAKRGLYQLTFTPSIIRDSFEQYTRVNSSSCRSFRTKTTIGCCNDNNIFRFCILVRLSRWVYIWLTQWVIHRQQPNSTLVERKNDGLFLFIIIHNLISRRVFLITPHRIDYLNLIYSVIIHSSSSCRAESPEPQWR